MARIVVVEDDENLLEHMSVLLAMHEHEVTGFSAAPSAQEVVSLCPDLTIMDIFLPNGNGVDLSGRIKSIDPELKIILTSADQHTLHFSGEVIANAVLPKPFSGKQLLALVEDVLEFVE
jgi:DNA-binding NtrC family response regulator